MKKKSIDIPAWERKYNEIIAKALGRLEKWEMTSYTHYIVQDEDYDNLLRYANGYQVSTGDYEGIHILQTYDLRRIYFEDKLTTYRFASWCQSAISNEFP